MLFALWFTRQIIKIFYENQAENFSSNVEKNSFEISYSKIEEIDKVFEKLFNLEGVSEKIKENIRRFSVANPSPKVAILSEVFPRVLLVGKMKIKSENHDFWLRGRVRNEGS